MNIESKIEIIGFGGACHWCTEAIFQRVPGVKKVSQGWISSDLPHVNFSEAVKVYFDPAKLNLYQLIWIHLNTHSSTNYHKLRNKYRSAIYYINQKQKRNVEVALNSIRKIEGKQFVTEIIYLKTFKLNQEKYLNYYIKQPTKPFCKNYILPKLDVLEKLLKNTQ